MEDDKIVLICAIGRSGSTTLQLILNTIPNSNICGENEGAVNSLLEFYKQIKNTYNRVDNIEFNKLKNEDKQNIFKIFQNGIKPSWYNSFELEQVKQTTRNTIITMFKKNDTTNVWGFKEIRYNGKLELLKEFRELFPQTKVILNIRDNIKKQSQSSWFKKDPNSFKKIIKETNEIVEFWKNNRDFCFLNVLEKMYNKQHMMQLFQFIGCSEHFNEDKIKNLLLSTRES
jgi:hypothetical protein